MINGEQKTDRQTDRTIDDKWRAKDRWHTINKKKVVINNQYKQPVNNY